MLVVRLVITTGRIFLFSAGTIYPKITFPVRYKNFRDVNNFFLKNFYIPNNCSTFAAELTIKNYQHYE